MAQQVYDNHNQEGFIVLTATLVVMAVGVAIAVTTLLLSINSSQTSVVREREAEARALANACAEYGINQVRLNTSYDYSSDSNLPITLGAGTCTVNNVTGSGDTGRGVDASGTVGTAVRRVSVTGLDVSGAPTITRWEEVASF